MKAKFSELNFLNYYVKNSEFSTYLKDSDDIESIKKKIHNRSFNITFEIFENINDPNFFYIDLNIDSFPKTKRKTSGYDFRITITANFELKEREKISKKKESQFVMYSALPMIISLARSEISHLTANGIFGKYVLPAIDLPDLVNSWISKNDL